MAELYYICYSCSARGKGAVPACPSSLRHLSAISSWQHAIMSEPDVPGLNQDNAIPPSSFKITGAGGVSARVCISDMSQPCADNGSQGDTSLSHGLSTDGHHLIITGSVVARNHSVVRLNHDQMQTIAFAMLDGIRSVRR